MFANSTHLGDAAATRVGLAAGGGIEYAFTGNWSAKFEYLFMTFGSWSYSSPLVAPAPVVGSGYSWVTTVTPREHVFRVGLNYRFGDPVAVVARY